METAKGYSKFGGIPEWAGIAFTAPTTMLTKLRAYRNTPPATHWPPEGNSKKRGYKVKNEQGPPPEGMERDPVFPLLMFSHGLGGSKTAYSSLCTEFASYGFVVCAVEHRDGSGARTFVNHRKRANKDSHGGAKVGKDDCENDPACEKEKEKWRALDHTDEELRQGYHHVDYIFPKNNPKDTAPNNEHGVDQELRNAQIELRLCELEEAYRVLKMICVGKGDEVARQNLRCEGYVGGSSRGLKGVDWTHWKGRFHVESFVVSGHSFGAATVVEVLRHTERFKNVQAGIIYDIWGAPIRPPAEDPKHRIHLPILGINSEAFMYWQSNFDAVHSLMEEASEHGSPAYLLTVRGSVHISQSDFSILYRHIASFFLKATVHPNRAIDLNISKRVFAGLQRKFKRNFQGGMGTGYTTSDEVWCHFKPTKEQLEKWVNKEGRGDKRIDEQSAVKGDVDILNDSDGDRSRTTALSDADEDERVDEIEAKTAPQSSKHTVSRNHEDSTKTSQGENSDDAADSARAYIPAEDRSYNAPPDTWLGMVPSLRDGPRSS
ncbi:hypothetical protein SNOG_11523 [Parastagonospora nodorum SN15]|uniref:1-alkyl-2-acetylglycerophosphocholine esterase n=1 Tax=Phaeosphaeria nodorum (strain SN15 / ATCC MYA-4574 / FGSC 10173) TaxID=321614 RepID=Q0U9P1_PHANO|nr:hypothetical protein SNOG_11523 [Parastagonospora nodorum SN15]EAT81231.2 hypothetical protein SNOG_11523 [Parastagonospora nodorum SN15]